MEDKETSATGSTDSLAQRIIKRQYEGVIKSAPGFAVPDHQKRRVAEIKEDQTMLRHLYDNRREFNIVALTGPIGCGLDEFTSIISQDFSVWKDQVRTPKDIQIEKEEEEKHIIIKQMVFKQKYTICYNFWNNHKEHHTILDYNKMCFLFMLAWIAKDHEKKDFQKSILDTLSTIIAQTEHGKEYLGDNHKAKASKLFSGVLKFAKEEEYENVFDEVKENELILDPFSIQYKQKLKFAKDFLNSDSKVARFYSTFCDNLIKEDYYIYQFLWHRLGVNIRKYGTPVKQEEGDLEGKHVFDIIELLNTVIKCATHKSRLFCINYLRNSLEIRYLSERYNAFYLIALHNNEQFPVNAIKKAVKADEKKKERIVEYTSKLCRTEVALDDYKKGIFASPDVEQCVSHAEIHIRVQPLDDQGKTSLEFYSTAEQWMKFASLIFHPGLITPSSAERCMQVAYTVRLNSSCVSRQVGAVITNKAHSIRSIGWNEVPYGQMPCGLRTLSDIVRQDFNDDKEFMYSDFERGKSNQTDIYKDGENFQEKITKDYKDVIDRVEERLHSCRPIFCFRELHNKYTGEKNQVYGRSLHAEENALMQIAKFGGEGLMGGDIYVTASPCELCSRKLYQAGIRKIVYIDPYPGIAREQTVTSGYMQPDLERFRGAYGACYHKLYTPLISPKDEQYIRCKDLLDKKMTK